MANPLAEIITKVLRRMGWDYATPRRGKVFSQSGDLLTVVLDGNDVEPLPNVPYLSPAGVRVTFAQGAPVLVTFIDRDPTQPVVLPFGGSALEVTIDAPTVKLGPSAGDVRLGPGAGGYRRVVAMGDTTAAVVNGSPAALSGVAPSQITNTVVKV